MWGKNLLVEGVQMSGTTQPVGAGADVAGAGFDDCAASRSGAKNGWFNASAVEIRRVGS